MPIPKEDSQLLADIILRDTIEQTHNDFERVKSLLSFGRNRQGEQQIMEIVGGYSELIEDHTLLVKSMPLQIFEQKKRGLFFQNVDPTRVIDHLEKRIEQYRSVQPKDLDNFLKKLLSDFV